MRKILILTIAMISTICNSQSKAETEDWISNKYAVYVYDVAPHNENTIKFENGYLVLLTYYDYYEKILLKNIKGISIKKFKGNKKDGYEIDLFCNGKDKCIEQGPYKNNTYSTPQKVNYVLTLSLSSEFEKNDLPKRMEKALLHLIKLYGGNATLRKEAF